MDLYKDQYGRPSAISVQQSEQDNRQKELLGQTLYFDPLLSSSGTVSCATCHDPRYGFEDGKARSLGVPGEALPRHSPTTVNLAWSSVFFWDGRAESLEEQALGPIQAGKEMSMPLDDLVSRLEATPHYQRAFEEVFPGEGVTSENIARAIAAFERTLVSANAPFDAWLEGDEDAISDAAKNGFLLFNTKAKCSSCHTGWNFTDEGFYDIGLPDDDIGRFAILDLNSQLHAFKTPGLRDIAERAPYMHTGAIPTLEAVVDNYNSGFVRRPSLSPLIEQLGLTEQEKADIVAFLKTLSSPVAPELIVEAERAEQKAKQKAQSATP